MFKKYIEIPNGSITYNLAIYECNDCGEEIPENWPRVRNEKKDIDYCRNCAFKRGLSDEKMYLNMIGLDNDKFHAGINPDGEIEIWLGAKTPPWER